MTHAERSGLVHEFLDSQLVADAAWPAALAASGHADAVSHPDGSWLVGPNDSWMDQPLLDALAQLGFLDAVWPGHTAGRYERLGMPLMSTS